MFTQDSGEMFEEIRNAEQVRDKHLDHWESMIERYHGSAFMNMGTEARETENNALTFISHMLPKLLWRNPSVRIGSRRAEARVGAVAIQHAMRRWMKDSHYRETARAWTIDFMFTWGVSLVTLDDNAQMQTPEMRRRGWKAPKWPVVSRLRPKEWGIDTAASERANARFEFHKWTRDKADLVRHAKNHPEEGWDLRAVMSLAPTMNKDELRRKEDGIPDRNEVVGYDIWVPEIDLKESGGPEKGFNGTIYTMAIQTGGDERDGRGLWLRKPRPFFGHPTGPYQLFGAHQVPNSIFPMGPLTSTEDQLEELNRFVKAGSVSMEHWKRGIIADSAIAEIIRDMPHDGLVSLENFSREQLEQIEMGGLAPQLVEMITMLRERYDRISGQPDLQRGVASGKATASEVVLADAAAQGRIKQIVDEYYNATTQGLEKVAFLMHASDRVRFPLDAEAGREMKMRSPWFQGGYVDKDGYGFMDYEMEIEPFSMEDMGSAAMRDSTQMGMGFLEGIAPLMPQMPYVRWQDTTKRFGDAANWPDFEKLFDYRKLDEVTQVEMAKSEAEASGQVQTPTHTGRKPEKQPTPSSTGAETKRNGYPGDSSGSKAGARAQGQETK